MNGRQIDLKKTVSALCDENPDIVGILAEAGFSEIVKPAMRATAGRFMTIPMGARMRGIPLDDVKEVSSATDMRP